MVECLKIYIDLRVKLEKLLVAFAISAVSFEGILRSVQHVLCSLRRVENVLSHRFTRYRIRAEYGRLLVYSSC